MSKDKETGPLVFVFIVLLTAVIGGPFYKDSLLNWSHLQSIAKALFFLMWLMLILSVLGLAATFFVDKVTFKGEKHRIPLLIFTIICCICCLLMEVGTSFNFYGGEQCFPYNLNPKIGFKPLF